MSATSAILRSEARLFRREPAAMFWILCFPTLLLVILGSIPSFRDVDHDLGTTLVALYTNIVILSSMLMAACQTLPGVLTAYRERGILRRISTTPASPGALLAAQFLIHLAAVVIASVIALVVARLAFGVDLPRQALGFLLVYILAVTAALAFGSLVSALAPNTKVAGAVGTIVFFPMMFTAGVWLPVAAMPDTLRTVVQLTPMGAAARGLDQAAAGDWPSAGHLLVVLAWALVAGVVAIRTFRWE